MSNHKKIKYLFLSISLLTIPILAIALERAEPIVESDLTIEVIKEEDIAANVINVSVAEVKNKNNANKYDDIIIKYSNRYDVSYKLMNAIINCENRQRDPNLQSRLYYNFTRADLGIFKGEREYSFGLVQINRHYNPNISHEQATDPDFSIDFLAKNLSKGNGTWWACYNKVRHTL